MLRLFVGLELPEPVRHWLTSLQTGYSGARWHATEHMHITLNFIGAFDCSRLAELTAALSAVSAPPLTIKPRGVGYFGRVERPLVIWAGVAPTVPLMALQGALQRRLATIEIAPEERGYVPHITLARVKDSDCLSHFLSRHADAQHSSFVANYICLYLSRRGEHGVEYQVIKRFPLVDRA